MSIVYIIDPSKHFPRRRKLLLDTTRRSTNTGCLHLQQPFSFETYLFVSGETKKIVSQFVISSRTDFRSGNLTSFERNFFDPVITHPVYIQGFSSKERRDNKELTYLQGKMSKIITVFSNNDYRNFWIFQHLSPQSSPSSTRSIIQSFKFVVLIRYYKLRMSLDVKSFHCGFYFWV